MSQGKPATWSFDVLDVGDRSPRLRLSDDRNNDEWRSYYAPTPFEWLMIKGDTDGGDVFQTGYALDDAFLRTLHRRGLDQFPDASDANVA